MYQVPSRMHSSLLLACILQMDDLSGTICCETEGVVLVTAEHGTACG